MTDYRYYRTDRAIQQSFMDLLQRQPFNKLNITMLTNEALISRPAFYEHYASIYELAAKMIQRYLMPLLNIFKRSAEYRKQNYQVADIFLKLNSQLEGVVRHRDEYQLIRSIPLGSHSFDSQLKDSLVRELRPFFTSKAVNSRLATVTLANILISNLGYVLEVGKVPTSKEVADSIFNIYQLLKAK